MLINNKEIALYVHWPYCLKKCPYCDFNSHVTRQPIDINVWETAYKNEIEAEQNILGKKTVRSIFFGGGTPSLMPPKLLESILNQVSKKWAFSKNIEITLEANPSSVEIKNFSTLKKVGVNRLSLGFQSLNNNSLKFLGRNHSVKNGLKALETAKNIFKRVSFDLIYGLPGHNEKIWEKELNEAIQISGEHISAYQLTIEKGTPFYASYRDKKFELPPEKTLLNLYNMTDELLSHAHLKKYEVSNYAFKNSECVHNYKIWEGSEYCGIGPGAHGRLILDNKWYASHKFSAPKIWLNKNLKKKSSLYLNKEISNIERAQEILLTSLRLTKGIDIKKAFNKLSINSNNDILNENELRKFKELNLIDETDSLLKVTNKGFPILNYITNNLIL